ncbi:MAG: hypothetical protein KBF98_02460 [Rhodoferax sp.]|nr:hypothetical protein [Rhodoferax sp.]
MRATRELTDDSIYQKRWTGRKPMFWIHAEFGFTNPILADSEAIIVAGHDRKAAAQGVSLQTV